MRSGRSRSAWRKGKTWHERKQRGKFLKLSFFLRDIVHRKEILGDKTVESGRDYQRLEIFQRLLKKFQLTSVKSLAYQCMLWVLRQFCFSDDKEVPNVPTLLHCLSLWIFIVVNNIILAYQSWILLVGNTNFMCFVSMPPAVKLAKNHNSCGLDFQHALNWFRALSARGSKTVEAPADETQTVAS